MSVWSSIDGTDALHYEGSHLDPRKAKLITGAWKEEAADQVDLAVVPNCVYEDHEDYNKEGYLPYLRLGLIVNNSAEGDVILNRKQVKKLKKELNKFLKDTKKPKEIERYSICDFIWFNPGNHACKLQANHNGDHKCCCGIMYKMN